MATDPNYEAATAATTANPSATITFGRLGEGIQRVSLKFQPMGISQFGNCIRLADYLGPSALEFEVKIAKSFIDLKSDEWVRGIEGMNRMFPDIHPVKGVNRMQVALLINESEMFLLRNYDHVLYRVSRKHDVWQHESSDHDVTLEIPGGGYVHSLTVDHDQFVGIYSDLKTEKWSVAEWTRSGTHIHSLEVPVFRYGIAVHKASILTVTDSRSREPHGIYIDNEILVPDIVGNDIVLLEGGSAGALVPRYTYEEKVNVPPELQYVPAALLGL